MAFRLESSDGSGGAHRIGATLSEINIIPLVDVILVLLLIFMLTAPLMHRGIDVNLPKSTGQPDRHRGAAGADADARTRPSS